MARSRPGADFFRGFFRHKGRILKIELSKTEGAVLVVLSGEITSRDDQHAMSDAMDEQLAAGERTFVLDLSLVPYVSSLGIAVLVAAYVKTNREGGKLRLVNPRPKVASIREMTKVADIFRTYSSVEEALNSD